MEDDGILLNFASPSNSSSNSTKKSVKVSGGKWTDRRKNQLKLEGRSRGNKNAKTSTPNPRSISGANSIPIKDRKRFTSSVVSEGDTPRPKRIKETNGENGGKDNTYVSSLFTANPDILQKEYQNQDDISNDNLPSNAPLSDATTFVSLGINELLSNHLSNYMRFNKPTRIQRSVIPNLLSKTSKNDLFIHSQTGSGKTLAFLLPILQKLTMYPNLNRQSGLFAIILTPTRELAIQIYTVLENLVRSCHRIVPGIVIGGEKKKSEKARLRKGVNILVATPGRLLDHMTNTQTLNLSQVRYLVMDEGDKLMELGFEESIQQIVENLTKGQSFDLDEIFPHKRINVLCSATYKPSVEKLSKLVLNNESLLKISNDNLDDDKELEMVPDQLTQQILIVPPKLRFVTLSGLLMRLTAAPNSKTIVFFSCADSVDYHFMALTREGKDVSVTNRKSADDDDNNDKKEETKSDKTAKTAPLLKTESVIYRLHGSLTQHIRTSTLNSFAKSTTSSVLFSTDVASRGLDLFNISNVIEFDPSFTIDDHLHRVGRTARSGLKGTSYLFLLPGLEENYSEKINQFHAENSIHFINFEELLKQSFGKKEETDTENDNTKKRRPNGKKEDNWDIHATTFQLNLERFLLDDDRSKELASNAFISHIRAYTTHLSSERDCFNLKAVHMGHLAKSFGLRETPRKVANVGVSKNSDGSQKKTKEDGKSKMLRMARLAVSSSHDEFNTF